MAVGEKENTAAQGKNTEARKREDDSIKVLNNTSPVSIAETIIFLDCFCFILALLKNLM
jgi:hypothetical protein